jgi:cytochrome c5
VGVSGAHTVVAVRCLAIALTLSHYAYADRDDRARRIVTHDSAASAVPLIRWPALYWADLRCRFSPHFQRVVVANTESSDRHFFNSFSLVPRYPHCVCDPAIRFARMIGKATQGQEVLLDPMRLKDVQRNIAPFAHVAVAGHDNSALAVQGAPKSGAAAAVVPTTGEQAFTTVCSVCHSLGINGAPKIGDHAAWGPRIAQGKEALYTHAIGGQGAMPPRGGTTWPDATIRMAVDYMVSLNK